MFFSSDNTHFVDMYPTIHKQQNYSNPCNIRYTYNPITLDLAEIKIPKTKGEARGLWDLCMCQLNPKETSYNYFIARSIC